MELEEGTKVSNETMDGGARCRLLGARADFCQRSIQSRIQVESCQQSKFRVSFIAYGLDCGFPAILVRVVTRLVAALL